MKAIRWIQNVAAVIAIAMAVSLADGIGITFKEACTAGMLVVLAVVMLLDGLWRKKGGLSDVPRPPYIVSAV